VNGELKIDNWTNHGETWDATTVTLTAGEPVPFTMEYYESTGGAVARLWWAGPGIPFAPVPGEALQTTVPAPPGYPCTFDEWLLSPHAPGAGEADNDDVPDLLEYALGTSATSGMQAAGRGLQLGPNGSGGINAFVVVPSNIMDIDYTLETSADLVHWKQTGIQPVVTSESVLTMRISWPAITPFVRLRVAQQSP
jgi:hypothetical protein